MIGTVIKIVDISKKYNFYPPHSDRLKQVLHSRRDKHLCEFYSRKNIDLEIKTGTPIGTVGKNGYGKSTLLKIISRILTPSSGTVNIKGKVVPLLELGEGFKPDKNDKLKLSRGRLYKAAKHPLKSLKYLLYERLFFAGHRRVNSTSTNNILIVDPIFRGSRLYYSSIVADMSEKQNLKVHILTRTNAITDQYYEYFSGLDPFIYELIKLPQDFWFGQIPDKGVAKTIDSIIQLNTKLNFKFIYFAGLPEYNPRLLKALLKRKTPGINDKLIFFVEYDASYFFDQDRAAKFIKKTKLMGNVQKKFPNLFYCLLDERIEDEEVARCSHLNKNLIYLPDPSPSRIIEERDRNFPEKTRILLVGIQSKRKGTSDVIDCLESFEFKNLNIEFFLAGRFEEDTTYLIDRIKKLSHLITFYEGYFQEKIMQKYYNDTDYVILPYNKTFHASSGVMAYATMFGKPLISTDHGLVGYRTKKFDLGYVYEAGDIINLFNTIKSLPARNTSLYQKLSENCKWFAAQHTIEMHQKRLLKTIKQVETID